MKTLSLLALGLLPLCTHGQSAYGQNPLVHTYSIVAYDPQTGEMGAAVQSHWFSVGTVVIWGEAGTGVVATQSFANSAFGPEGLRLMREGLPAEQALQELIQADDGRDFRQVAFLDAQGNAHAYTGAKCIAAAGHLTGPHYSVQANIMLNDRVWPAMAEAFEESAGQPLAERLLIAMEAAQYEGGDLRGSQSAALLVVSPENTGQVWVDRRVDLRVDDHASPLVELRRLLRVKRAYDFMNTGDLAIEAGDTEAAETAYGTAQAMFPDNLEMKYWHAVALANAKKLEKALPLFAQVFQADPNWITLTQRLMPNGILSVTQDELMQILRQAKK